MNNWNWTPRAKALGDAIKMTGTILFIWVGMWLLFTGHLPPNPLTLP